MLERHTSKWQALLSKDMAEGFELSKGAGGVSGFSEISGALRMHLIRRPEHILLLSFTQTANAKMF